ncbi:tRNA (carboxymethyluridine(34)-5-O)-methyltransferase [Porphyridium purpureum]|uniref:tRNA (Carboxymethyluridine(34)-5-O)-methyltransferase n=1 Tax=Porphyridium purpureum TaxID=35688 RepID=A0A5J4Z778_PORPP|nr:tRNA (carboxymethyluridine(34)-5-O)-methyltransferase [Porphyridium purpureum]|eukprot:POR1948..scf295_1
MNELPDVEARNVVQVYDAIASHFDSTRFAVWPGVRAFLDGLKHNSLVLDIGCGNGKYIKYANCGSSSGATSRRRLWMIGSDVSASLSAITASHASECVVADGLRSPYRSSCADAVISIAVLHHISSEARRIDAVRELLRLLRVGGTLLIYVWAREQQDEAATVSKWTAVNEKNDFLVPWTVLASGARTSNDDRVQRALNAGGELLDDDIQKQAVRLYRFYHVFQRNELEDLIQKHFSDVARILHSFYEKSNWAVVCEKLET